ncbi:TraR/DksA family transcriptional regulator [Leekyejoonella antrihumi]|uniref:TraR/DksA family transcriptional regulator n=1 Tax=Leekyejoonella antrihumi TaxID=1660198 RepID=A0A563DS01_9MICO|nr:TraR/DksA family transcriptional regulator [Leekyejoonella antrihumi]
MQDALRARREVALERLAALTSERARIIDASRDDNADDEHDPEGATIAWDREQTTALVQSTSAQLQQIDLALARIADGWDGSCHVCGKPIGHERLLARPATDQCIACAERPGRSGR